MFVYMRVSDKEAQIYRERERERQASPFTQKKIQIIIIQPLFSGFAEVKASDLFNFKPLVPNDVAEVSKVNHVNLVFWFFSGWPLVGNEGPSTFTLVYWGFMNPHSLRAS